MKRISNRSRVGLRVSQHISRPLVIAAVSGLLASGLVGCSAANRMPVEEQAAAMAAAPAPDTRLQWWREARFGMFIHWGLYAIPAGKWKDDPRTDHGEWILDTAQIPVAEYEKLASQFNPRHFDANAIAQAAKDAGMQYIVITSKHHDGFALFDSKVSDYDVMATPFKRDVMKELAEATNRTGLKMCWYHSIMDWHHPDYLPRRPWETRSAEGADFRRYVDYMKSQLTELLTNYGPIGVLWFDGQWEKTWNDGYGQEVYDHVRSLQPNIIVNNRVGRTGGAHGLDRNAGRFIGDYATPEQYIPSSGPQDLDWETCMTMNDHWGFCAADQNFKSSREILRMLADIASKGGNFLLNVGPDADGRIPKASLERLADVGQWMRANGESIHGTHASPLPPLPWGRCTAKTLGNGDTRLYLHVFDRPAGNELVIPGIANDPLQASVLEFGMPLKVTRQNDAIVVDLNFQMRQLPNPLHFVVALDVAGSPDVTMAPRITARHPEFLDSLTVNVSGAQAGEDVRFTTDGTPPTASSAQAAGPVEIKATSLVMARVFRDGKPISPIAEAVFTKVKPRPAVEIFTDRPGLQAEYFEADIQACSELNGKTPKRTTTTATFDATDHPSPDQFCFRFTGFVRAPADGLYQFSVTSDDGSQLWIGDQLVVDNDGPHVATEQSGFIALGAGLHPIRVVYFENGGSETLSVAWEGPGIDKQVVPASALFRAR